MSDEKFTWHAGDLTPIDTGTRRYDGPRTGSGRWSRLDGIGTVWTNDRDATRLGPIDGPVDNQAANLIVHRLLAYAESGVPASTAFDFVVADFGPTTVHAGILDDLFD